MFDKTVTIRGMHATYWKALCAGSGVIAGPGDEGKFKIFNRYIDAYLLAPILGCLNNRKGSNLPPSDDDAGMQANILIKNSQHLTTIMRTIVLVDKSSNLTTIDKIERAFRGDDDPEVMEANMKLFDDYFRGGIEILYEQFSNCITDEDYLNEIHNFVEAFYKDLNIERINVNIPE